MKEKETVPIYQKSGLTLEEASSYTGIGVNKLRQMSDRKDCPFVLWVGNKRLLRREKLDKYLNEIGSI